MRKYINFYLRYTQPTCIKNCKANEKHCISCLMCSYSLVFSKYITERIFFYDNHFLKASRILMDDSQKLCLEKNDDDDEVKAKEKIIQRREARRRNILQNAKSRLERLNGRVSTANNGGDQRSNSYGSIRC